MPVVGLEPIRKFNILRVIVYFALIFIPFKRSLKESIFRTFHFLVKHYATRNATRKKYNDFFVFWHRINKIFVLSQKYPKRSQNHPNSKDLSYHFWFLDLRTFRTLSDSLGHFRKNLLSNPTFMLSLCFIFEIYGPAALSQQNTQLSRKSYVTQTH